MTDPKTPTSPPGGGEADRNVPLNETDEQRREREQLEQRERDERDRANKTR